jgi:MFS family permease
MAFQSYREVLRLPRVASMIAVMFFARLPMTTVGVVMTLYVVTETGRGYAEAGLVGTAMTLGAAAAAPVTGRLIDRRGLRPVVAVCGLFSVSYWLLVPHLPYLVLVLLTVPAGLFTVPANSLTRQFLTVLVPEPLRRAVFSLDTTLAEISFLIGPIAGVFVLTQISATAALTGIGVCIGATSLYLFVTNHPTRGSEPRTRDATGGGPAVQIWRDGRIGGALIVTSGTLFTLIGTELALIAALGEIGRDALIGVVIAMMSAASVVGGLVHGAVRRSLPQVVLSAGMAALVLPVGLLTQSWWLLGLALIPMNLLVAPSLAASSENLAALAPPAVRGQVMGLQDTSSRLGIALGGLLTGVAIDAGSATGGFVAAGLGGLLLAATGQLVKTRQKGAQPC